MDLDYIAGFFDGDGCICLSKVTRGKINVRPFITIGQRNPEVLYYIQSALKMGRIFKSMSKGFKRDVQYTWSISSWKEAHIFVALMEGRLIEKRQQLELLKDTIPLAVGRGHNTTPEQLGRLLEASKMMKQLNSTRTITVRI